MHIDYFIDGTSNATGFTANLPAAPLPLITGSGLFGFVRARDNGGIVTSNAIFDIEPSTSTIALYKDLNLSGWTSSGEKSAIFTVDYLI